MTAFATVATVASAPLLDVVALRILPEILKFTLIVTS